MGVIVRTCFILIVSLNATSADAASQGINSEEYRLFMAWEAAQKDEVLKDLPADARLRAVAKRLQVKSPVLEHAISKVAPRFAELPREIEGEIRRLLLSTEIGTRLDEVLINAEQSHVVAGVKWRCGDARDADVEAAYAAWAVAQASPLVQTIAVWCTDNAQQKLFSAKIGREASIRIRREDVPRFATSRYIRLFEDVRRGPHV